MQVEGPANLCSLDNLHIDTDYIVQSDVPQKVDAVLRCRPKYATEHSESPVAMLYLVRNTSDKANEDNKERCVPEGADCVLSRCSENIVTS